MENPGRQMRQQRLYCRLSESLSIINTVPILLQPLLDERKTPKTNDVCTQIREEVKAQTTNRFLVADGKRTFWSPKACSNLFIVFHTTCASREY